MTSKIIVGQGGTVRVEIYDHDATDADDLLGQAELSLSLRPESEVTNNTSRFSKQLID